MTKKVLGIFERGRQFRPVKFAMSISFKADVILSSGGLTIVMIGAFGIRIRIRDSMLQTLPSIVYLLITIYLTILFAEALH